MKLSTETIPVKPPQYTPENTEFDDGVGDNLGHLPAPNFAEERKALCGKKLKGSPSRSRDVCTVCQEMAKGPLGPIGRLSYMIWIYKNGMPA